MARGEQVYVIRDMVGVPYQHHGIDCGDGTVIHYRKVGTATISRTNRESFARGHLVYQVSQSVRFIPDVVIRRAESRLGEQRYNLFFNNCEHFANWCTIGVSVSPQLKGFGLRLEQIHVPRWITQQAAMEETPQGIVELFTNALNNIAIANNTLLPEYDQLQHDSAQWKKVAEIALSRNREDLARAALHKRYVAQNRTRMLKAQLQELSDLQIAIQTDQNQALKRLSEHYTVLPVKR
ncbi:MAG: lecithin retinol acyltransferase family protein [Cyanobacteria bacterium P01_D01_bin.156]